MTTPTAPDLPICPLGITERTLSALRDDSVSQTDARLAAHVANCPACSQRLAAFSALADILRSERPPEPDGRLWPAVTAATTIADSPTSRRRLRLTGAGSASITWSRVGALVAVLLLTVGFVALFSLRRPAPPVQQTATATSLSTPVATATSQPSPLPSGPLAWRPVGTSSPQGDIVFADDGKSAYKCSVSDDAQGNAILNIWRTSDRGAHWIPAREVPNNPTVNGCQLVVDASDPSVAALAWQPRGGGAGDSYTGLMTTIDGGVSWQAASSQPFVRIDQLDSHSGEIFAVRETANSANSVEYHLWASSDRMRSWRQMDQGVPAEVAGFWLQPDGAGILVVVSDGAAGDGSQLWYSPDGGASWSPIHAPGTLPPYMIARFTNAGAAPNGIIARWLQGQLHICFSNATIGASTPTPPAVTCSTDGGKTWHARPLMTLTAVTGASVGVNLVGITNDGAVLAAGLGSLYRLPAGSSQWQSLGSLPEVYVFYCPLPGAGVLWAAPTPPGEPADSQNRVFTADYTP